MYIVVMVAVVLFYPLKHVKIVKYAKNHGNLNHSSRCVSVARFIRLYMYTSSSLTMINTLAIWGNLL